MPRFGPVRESISDGEREGESESVPMDQLGGSAVDADAQPDRDPDPVPEDQLGGMPVEAPDSGGSGGGSDSGGGGGGSGPPSSDPGDIRAPGGETIEGPTESVNTGGTPKRTVTYGGKAGAGLSEAEASSAIGAFAARNSDVVKTGANDRTGTINVDDIGIRQTGGGLEYFFKDGRTVRERTPRANQSRSFGTTGTPTLAAGPRSSGVREAMEEAEERAEGIADSDRKLYKAAGEAKADSFAEGVAFSDRKLVKNAARMNVEQQIEEAGADPDDYDIDVTKVEEGFTARARTQEQSFIDDVTGGMFTEVSGIQRDIREDINAELAERVDPVVTGLTEPRTPEAEAAADYLGDVSADAVDVGEDVFTAATILPRAAAAGGAEISARDLEKETIATGAAAAVAAPEPVSSVGGGAVLLGLGAAAGAGYAATELGIGAGNQDTNELDVEDASATVTEIEPPEGGYTQFSELDVAGETQPSELSVPQDTGTADPTTIRTSELVQPEQYEDLGRETPDELFVGDGLNYIRDGDEFILTGERPPEFFQDRDFPTGESAVVGRGTGTTGVEDVDVTDNTASESTGTGEATETGQGVGSGLAGSGAVDVADRLGHDVDMDLVDVFDTGEPTVQTPGFDQPGTYEFDSPSIEPYLIDTGSAIKPRRKRPRLPDLKFGTDTFDGIADDLGDFEKQFSNPVSDPDSILSGKAFGDL